MNRSVFKKASLDDKFGKTISQFQQKSNLFNQVVLVQELERVAKILIPNKLEFQIQNNIKQQMLFSYNSFLSIFMNFMAQLPEPSSKIQIEFELQDPPAPGLSEKQTVLRWINYAQSLKIKTLETDLPLFPGWKMELDKNDLLFRTRYEPFEGYDYSL